MEPDRKIKFWKDHRIINEHGLVVCEERERLFENAECAFLLEDLLRVYQQEQGVPLHYMHYLVNKSSEENQIITYKCYIGYCCHKKEILQGKQKLIGEMFIHYRIIRLSKEKVHCKYPFVLLFDIKCGEVQCVQCKAIHISRIYESSFYVILTQFGTEVKKKLKFMTNYPNYTFTPHSFISKVTASETVYENIKDHSYEPSYYFERCELVLVNSIKLELLKRGMDCQAIRLENFIKQGHQCPPMTEHKSYFKLKYMCRKCQPRQIWTTRDTVVTSFCIIPLQKVFQSLKTQNEQQKKLTFYSSKLVDKYTPNPEQQQIENIENPSNPQEKPYIYTLFKTQERRLDRSINKQVLEYQEFEKDIANYGRRHSQIKEYQYPYMIVYNITIPKMNCVKCNKEKDGLIYITNLIYEAHSSLNHKVIKKTVQTHFKLMKKQINPKRTEQINEKAELPQEEEEKQDEKEEVQV